MPDSSEPYYQPPQAANDIPRRPPPPPPPPPPRSGAGSTFLQSCLVAGCATVLAPVLIVGGVFVLLFLGLSSGLSEAKGSFAELMQTASTASNMRERVVRAGTPGAGKIAIVSIHGTIAGNGSPLEGDGRMQLVADQLRSAARDGDVKAVLLQVDSPGGGLTASDLLHHEVAKLRDSNMTVLAWAGGMMASGGYYVAVAADRIMASPTATVGSIGVIMNHFQVEGLLDTLGVRVAPITSGERKDLGSPFREMTPAEREFLQKYIDASHSRFVDIVAEGRNMEREKVAALADGGIFTADAALANGLVDAVGYIDEAVAWLEGEVGRKDMTIVSYRRMVSFADVFGEAGASAAEGAVRAAREADAAPRAMAVYGGGR